MKISLIAAMSLNRVIGKNNDLPWHLPDDMKYFMQTTKGHYVLMGRKNFESIPEKFRPLPNRVNIVITRQPDYVIDNCHVVHSLEEGIAIAQKENQDELFIIGGAQVYALSLPLADKLYLTEIDAVIEGDTYFPDYDKKNWREISRTYHPADSRHDFPFDFVIYEKTNN